MIPAVRGSAISLTLALLFVCSCSASRNDSLNTSNIGVADGAVPDEDAETDPEPPEMPPLEDAGPDPSGLDAGEAATPDADPDTQLDTGIDAAADAEIAPDAVVSIEVADAGEAPDTTVVTEIPRCGDGHVDPDEECDQGTNNSDSVAGACRVNCRSPRCGDSVLDQGEACDQGATNSDTEANACRANCTESRCGDNVIDRGEQCDSGDARSDTAAGACRLDCRSARCGDGVRDADEACDDGNSVDADACRNTCRSARCGDQVVDPDEECDDGNTTNGDTCQSTCRLPTCGDRVVDSSEQCDDGNTAENDGCRSNCQTGCVSAQACSDGAFCNGPERCLNGVCQPAASPVSLDDSIGCTVDTCDEAQDRVIHTPMNTLCTADAPMCSAASSTTSTATCDAARGCVTRSTTQACNDSSSTCALLGSGNYTLTTYTPVCNSANTSCGSAAPSERTCPATPASCSVGRVFTGVTAATCNPNAETCGTLAPAVDDCTTRDKNSCVGNTTFTQVRGTCSAPNGCASTTSNVSCPTPADACANARVRTFAPACDPNAGCLTAGTQTSDTACRANPTSCGAAGPNKQPAIQTYGAACDPNNASRCLEGGAPAAPEYCQARAPVCNNTAARVPFVTNYAPACDGASCVEGGVQQQAVDCKARTDTTCGPTGTRGLLQETGYAPACDPSDGRRCLEGGTPVVTDCTASPSKCERDPNANQRAAASTYTRACQGAICLSGGSENKTYCDEIKTTCSANNVATDYLDSCNGTTCATSTTTCTQQTLNICNSKRSGYDIRRYTGICSAGEGCTFNAAGSTSCESGPPFCQVVPTNGAVQSCGGCVSNADGVPGCRARTTCTTCTRGCNDATGLCNIAIVLPGLPGGGVIGAVGNLGF